MRPSVQEAYGAIYEAYRLLQSHSREFLRVTKLPALLLVVIAAFKIEAPDIPAPANFALAFLDLFVYAALAISVHRVVLIGPDAIRGSILIADSRKTFRFLLTSLAISIFALTPSIVLIGLSSLLPSIGTSLLAFAVGAPLALYLFSRFALALPSIAIDDSLTLSAAYSVSREHIGALLIVIALVPATGLLASWLFIELPISYVVGEKAAQFVSFVIYIPFMVFEVAAISALYRTIREHRNAI